MRLSNTLMMDSKLMPTTKKAFTLAEVLITLSILGVVAALTIPSLVNRQSDLAAQVKLKKAISNYEDVIGVYMAEHETASAAKMLDGDCDKITEYFKVVKQGDDEDFCDFVTADGVAWRVDPNTGNASITDNENAGAARYSVTMWNYNNRANSNGEADNVSNIAEDDSSLTSANIVTTVYGGKNGGGAGGHLIDTSRGMTSAPLFLQGTYYCGANGLTIGSHTISCAN